MNKTPTLEEVQAHYKNVYSVVSWSMNGRISVLRKLYLYNNTWFTKCYPWDVIIWSDNLGYAEKSETMAQRFIRISRVVKD